MSTFVRNLELKEKLSLDDLTKLESMMENKRKNKVIAYLFLVFLSCFGLHRIYAGHRGSGIGMAVLFFMGFINLLLFLIPTLLSSSVYTGIIFLLFAIFLYVAFYIWWTIDLFLLSGMIDQRNIDIEYNMIHHLNKEKI